MVSADHHLQADQPTGHQILVERAASGSPARSTRSTRPGSGGGPSGLRRWRSGPPRRAPGHPVALFHRGHHDTHTASRQVGGSAGNPLGGSKMGSSWTVARLTWLDDNSPPQRCSVMAATRRVDTPWTYSSASARVAPAHSADRASGRLGRSSHRAPAARRR